MGVVLMLAPIPFKMLQDSAVFMVAESMDRYQNAARTQYTQSHVHLQPSSETKKTAQDTEVVLRAVLFVDGSYSTPALDLMQLQADSLAVGKPMRVRVTNSHGVFLGEYEVLTVEALPDVPATRIHHYELGLV